MLLSEIVSFGHRLGLLAPFCCPGWHPLGQSGTFAPTFSLSLFLLSQLCPLLLSFCPSILPITNLQPNTTTTTPSPLTTDAMAATRVFASRLASQMATKAARPAMRAPAAAAKRTISE